MRHRRTSLLIAFAAFTCYSGVATAASVSYLLDQSNADPLLPDGQPYLQVAIADGTAGAIDFTVSLLPRLTDAADSGFGIRAFAFNSTGPASVLLSKNILGLPSGWAITFGRSVGDFGIFDAVLTIGSALTPIAPQFTFSVAGISADSIADYAVLSHGRAAQGKVYFAALVGGLQDQDPGPKTLTKAWFGGAASVAVVPVPGSLWLLVSALAPLGLVRRPERPPGP